MHHTHLSVHDLGLKAENLIIIMHGYAEAFENHLTTNPNTVTVNDHRHKKYTLKQLMSYDKKKKMATHHSQLWYSFIGS